MMDLLGPDLFYETIARERHAAAEKARLLAEARRLLAADRREEPMVRRIVRAVGEQLEAAASAL